MRPSLAAALVGAAMLLAPPLATPAAAESGRAPDGTPVVEAGGMTFHFRGLDRHDFRGGHRFRGHRFGGHRFRDHRSGGRRFRDKHFLHRPKRFPHIFFHSKRFRDDDFHHKRFRHRHRRHKPFRDRRHHRDRFDHRGFRQDFSRGSGILLYVPGVGFVIR